LPTSRFVIYRELIIEGEPFEMLQLRLYPAAIRIEKLAIEHPATYIAFNLRVGPDGKSLLEPHLSGSPKELDRWRVNPAASSRHCSARYRHTELPDRPEASVHPFEACNLHADLPANARKLFDNGHCLSHVRDVQVHCLRSCAAASHDDSPGPG
jgi:hypothetical protein